MIKSYAEWHILKTTIQHRTPPPFREREIWWCHLGLNIKHEADGKGNELRRPVLVLRKFNTNCFIGVPLTTASRLTSKMGQMKTYPFEALREKIKEML
jgi:mRNA-degrading endonuclease toxin of MazEF toxin-antitoxin module